MTYSSVLFSVIGLNPSGIESLTVPLYYTPQMTDFFLKFGIIIPGGRGGGNSSIDLQYV